MDADAKYNVRRSGRTNVSRSDRTANDSPNDGEDWINVYKDKAPISVCKVFPKATNKDSKFSVRVDPLVSFSSKAFVSSSSKRISPTESDEVEKWPTLLLLSAALLPLDDGDDDGGKTRSGNPIEI